MSKTTVEKYLKVGRALHIAPDMFKSAKSLAAAEKILKKNAKQQSRVVHARVVEERISRQSGEDRRTKLAKSFIVGDFFEKIKTVSDRSVDIVECDPPFGIDLDKNKKGEGSLEYAHYIEWERSEYLFKMRTVLNECWRVLRDPGWLLLSFANDPWGPHLLKLLREEAGRGSVEPKAWTAAPNRFRCRNLPLIWFRSESGQTNQPDIYLPHVYDTIFYARKGKPQIQHPRGDVYNARALNPKVKEHKTERPIALYQDIFYTFAKPGDTILSTFVGAGRVILAADNLNMEAFGFDLNEHNRNRFVADLLVNNGEPGKWRD